MSTKEQRKELLVFGWQRENTKKLKMVRVPIVLTNLFVSFYNNNILWTIPRAEFDSALISKKQSHERYGPIFVCEPGIQCQLYVLVNHCTFGVRFCNDCSPKNILELQMRFRMIYREDAISFGNYRSASFDHKVCNNLLWTINDIPDQQPTDNGIIYLEFGAEVARIQYFKMPVNTSIKWTPSQNNYKWMPATMKGWNLKWADDSKYYQFKVQPQHFLYNVEKIRVKCELVAEFKGKDNTVYRREMKNIFEFERKQFCQFSANWMCMSFNAGNSTKRELDEELLPLAWEMKNVDLYWQAEITCIYAAGSKKIAKNEWDDFGFVDVASNE